VTARTVAVDTAALQRTLDKQTDMLVALAEELAEIRALVSRGQAELLRRVQEVQTAAGREPVMTPARPTWGPERVVPAATAPDTARVAPGAGMTDGDYARLVTRIRALVRTVVPPEAIVAVASRGDSALIDLDGRAGWHFPRCDDGRYAGHHPKDSEAAIEHLEELRRRGARYLMFPQTGMWWLTHYDGLRRHLEDHYRVALRREDACLIFDLESKESR
jgi:hypothetical protein